MQIPSLHMNALRLTGLDNVSRNAPPTGGDDTGGVRKGGDSLELSGDRPGSPAARVAHFAEKIEARLAKMAENLGPEGKRLVAAATEKFQSNIDRVQSALADGTLSRRDLANAISNIMDGLRDGLKSGGVDLDQGGRALPSGPLRRVGVEGIREDDGDQGLTDVERIEQLAAGINERLDNLRASTSGETSEALKNAQAAFNEHVQRILDGIADGSLTGDDLAAGVQNTLQMVETNVQRSMGVEDPDGSARGVRGEIADVVGHEGPDSISLYGPGLSVETLDQDVTGLDTIV